MWVMTNLEVCRTVSKLLTERKKIREKSHDLSLVHTKNENVDTELEILTSICVKK